MSMRAKCGRSYCNEGTCSINEQAKMLTNNNSRSTQGFCMTISNNVNTFTAMMFIISIWPDVVRGHFENRRFCVKNEGCSFVLLILLIYILFFLIVKDVTIGRDILIR